MSFIPWKDAQELVVAVADSFDYDADFADIFNFARQLVMMATFPFSLNFLADRPNLRNLLALFYCIQSSISGLSRKLSVPLGDREVL